MLLVFIGRNRFDLSRRFPGHTALNRSETRDRLAEYLSGRRRTAIVASHPDDETIGLGARLAAFENAVFFIVTDGAPENLADARAAGFTSRADYAAARARELEMVLTCSGVQRDGIQRLGLIDQRVSFCMYELACDLALRISRVEPEIVITHPYEGGHPDHDATAFAVHSACRLLQRAQALAPAIIEMSSYHWNGSGMETEAFLPYPGDAIVFDLTEQERSRKKQLLACYATQKETLSAFPLRQEMFRFAPSYDFTRLPHSAPLFYDHFDWGITSAAWQELARAAIQKIEAT
jgi:N-acetylglucosamine malate deacetylase 2